MTLRYAVLAAVAANPGATEDEICDAVEHDQQKVLWSVRDCANKAGLLRRCRDDISGRPGYHLTDAGRLRLEGGPGTLQGANRRKPENAQPAVAQNTGSSGSTLPAGRLPVEARAVAATPASDDPASESADDDDDVAAEMPPADAGLLAAANRMLCERMDGIATALRESGLPRLADVTSGEDLQQHVAALACAYQMAVRAGDATQRAAQATGFAHPSGLLRVTELTVVPPGEPVYSENATTVRITDEESGEFVVLEQHAPEHGWCGKVAVVAEEWPAIRYAVDQMLAACRGCARGDDA